ncbi:hypothetical protein OEZ85_009414 [Tetradesmus obliquus]|uniref:Uncharacterized protein n=1 Tax=Tetradesmus obliquus TaxID=3088 RepID=A0ABY8U976_TETOB|nr:hypothetical protein OEZ85_009414 [Tetradesmus obliquus]
MMISVSGCSIAQQRHALCAGRTPTPALQQQAKQLRCPPAAVWTRPTPDRDENFTAPSYVPTPGGSPVINPYRQDDQPLYTPSAPEFKPAELPEQQKEMPKGPTMPERRPDPIPAGNPKEKPPAGEPQKEAPPTAPKEK